MKKEEQHDCLTLVADLDGQKICTSCGAVIEEEIQFTPSDYFPEVARSHYSTPQGRDRALYLSKVQTNVERREFSRRRKVTEMAELIGGITATTVLFIAEVVHSILESHPRLNTSKLFLAAGYFAYKRGLISEFD